MASVWGKAAQAALQGAGETAEKKSAGKKLPTNTGKATYRSAAEAKAAKEAPAGVWGKAAQAALQGTGQRTSLMNTSGYAVSGQGAGIDLYTPNAESGPDTATLKALLAKSRGLGTTSPEAVAQTAMQHTAAELTKQKREALQSEIAALTAKMAKWRDSRPLAITSREEAAERWGERQDAFETPAKLQQQITALQKQLALLDTQEGELQVMGEQREQQAAERQRTGIKNMTEGERTAQYLLGSYAGGLTDWSSGLVSAYDAATPDEVNGQKLHYPYIENSRRTKRLLEDGVTQAGKSLSPGMQKYGGMIARGTGYSTPSMVLSMMPGVKALGGGKGIAGLLRNPLFWTSAIPMYGSSYSEALSEGANEGEAQAMALMNGFAGAVVEIGGGVEQIPRSLPTIRTWLKGLLDEGKEEVIQGVIEQLAKKITYDREWEWNTLLDNELFSLSDDTAVINPARAGEEFLGGALVGGVLGGAQTLAGKMAQQAAYVQLGQEYTADAEKVQQALAIGLAENARGTDAYIAAQRMAEQVEKTGKAPSAAAIGRMLAETATDEAKQKRRIEAEVLRSAEEAGADENTAADVAAVAVRFGRRVRFFAGVAGFAEETATDGGQYSIVTTEDGKTYVTSDRNVLSGEDAEQWRKQVTQFFNDVLLKNGSLTVDTAQGDRLTITKNETLWKGTDRYKTVQGNRVRLTDGEYYIKLQALSHIDELAETAHLKKDNNGSIRTQPDAKNHGFAKDGFAYPVAFFEDRDGQHYRITFSVGVNGDTATIYSIGKIKEANAPTGRILSTRGSEAQVSALTSDTTIPQNGAGVNTQYMQKSTNHAQVAGMYDAGTDTVLVNAALTTDEAVDFVLKHELTHAIEGSKDYAKLEKLVHREMGEGMFRMAAKQQARERLAAGDTTGAQSAEKEVVADWIGRNLYKKGFAQAVAGKSRPLATDIYRALWGVRRALGLTQNGRMQARIRLAEMRFADVLESDYHRSGEGEQRSINPDFAQEYAAWDKKSTGGYFVLGTTSEALQSIGIDPARIYWDKSKIKKILENPNHHMETAIPKVPELLEHPILIMQSQTVLNRVVVLGEINDDMGYPVLCALELAPNGEINKFIKVASAYGKDSRNGVQHLIDTSSILYVDPNKNRTDSWLEARRLQLPVGLTNYGSIGRVTLLQKDVKGNYQISGDNPKKTAMQAAFEKAEKRSAQSQSMQNSDKNSSDGQKSYLPTDMQERERAAATQKAENTRRLAEQQQQQEQAEQAETAEELKKQNAALQKKVEKLQRELKPTDKKTVREADVLALGRRLVREYSSEVSGREIQADLQNLGNQLVNGTDWQTLRDAAEPVARRIVENASVLVNSEEAELYNDLKQYLRENPLTISDTDKADIADYEAFRRRNQQRLHLSKDGVPVDVAYAELQESFGRSLFPEALTHPADQLQHIAEVLDRLQPLYENPHGDIDAAVEMCTGDIIDGLLDESVRQSAPTYADKEKAKRDAMRRQYTARLREAARTQEQAVEAVKQEYREKYREAVQKERGKREDAVKKVRREQREQQQRAKEKREATQLRRQASRIRDELDSLLEHPDKKRHINAEQLQPVMELLDTLRESPEGIRQEIADIRQQLAQTADARRIERLTKQLVQREKRLQSVSEQLDRIQTLYKTEADDTLPMPQNNLFQKKIDQVKEALDGRSLDDLSNRELREVVDLLRGVVAQIREKNTLHSKAFSETAQQEAQDFIRQMQEAKGYRSERVRNAVLWQLSPTRFFDCLCGWEKNSVGRHIGDALVAAETKQLEIRREFTELFYDKLNGKEAAQYERLSSTKKNDLVDVGLVDKDGKPMLMTRGLMLSLYMGLCAEGNREAMMDGGVRLPNLQRYYSGDTANAYEHGQRLIPRDLSEGLHDVLTQMQEYPKGSQERAELDRRYTELTALANQRLDEVKDRIAAEMTDYERDFLRLARQWLNRNSKEHINEATRKIWGYEAARVRNYYPIYRDKNFVNTPMESLVQNLTVDNTGSLKARVRSRAPVLIADITQVLESSAETTAKFAGFLPFTTDFQKLYNTTLPGGSTSVKEVLAQKWGKGKAGLGVTGDQYIQNTMADISGSRKAPASPLNFFRRNAARATMTLNLRSAATQLAAVPVAASELGWKHMAAGVAKGAFTVNSELLARMRKYSVYAYERMRGDGGTEEIALAHSGENAVDKLFNSVDKKTKGWLLSWSQKVDIYSVAMSWKSCEDTIRETRPDLKPESDAFNTAVGKLLDTVIRNTQNNNTLAERSDLFRTKNEALKFLTMFKQDSNQAFNILAEATGRYRAAVKSGDAAQITAAKKRLVNSYTAVVAGSAVVVSLIRVLINALLHHMNGYRDDTGKVTAGSVASAMGQEMLAGLAGTVVFGDALYEAFAARVFGEKYYGVNDMALETAGSLLEDLATGNLSSANTWKYIFFDLTKVLGIPLQNAWGIAEGFRYHLEDIQSGHFLSMESGYTVSDAMFYRRLYRYIRDGDTEKADHLRQYLLARGKTETQIQAGMRTAVKGNDKEYDREKNRAVKELCSRALYKRLTAKEKDKAEDALSSYIADLVAAKRTGGALSDAHKKVVRAEKLGIDPADYYLAQTVKDAEFADEDGDGKVSRAEYRRVLSEAEYKDMLQRVLLGLKKKEE